MSCIHSQLRCSRRESSSPINCDYFDDECVRSEASDADSQLGQQRSLEVQQPLAVKQNVEPVVNDLKTQHCSFRNPADSTINGRLSTEVKPSNGSMPSLCTSRMVHGAVAPTTNMHPQPSLRTSVHATDVPPLFSANGQTNGESFGNDNIVLLDASINTFDRPLDGSLPVAEDSLESPGDGQTNGHMPPFLSTINSTDDASQPAMQLEPLPHSSPRPMKDFPESSPESQIFVAEYGEIHPCMAATEVVGHDTSPNSEVDIQPDISLHSLEAPDPLIDPRTPEETEDDPTPTTTTKVDLESLTNSASQMDRPPEVATLSPEGFRESLLEAHNVKENTGNKTDGVPPNPLESLQEATLQLGTDTPEPSKAVQILDRDNRSENIITVSVNTDLATKNEHKSLSLSVSSSKSPLRVKPGLRPPPGPGPGPGPKLGLGSGPGPGFRPGLQLPVPTQYAAPAAQTRNQPSLEKEWERVKRIRAEVWSLRSRIHEMRGVLRQKQLVKSKADDIFFQYVRRQASGSDPFKTFDEQSTLESLLRDCETARNEYGPLEDDCNLLESDLGNQEYVLQKLESKLYDRQVNVPASQLEVLDAVGSQPMSSSDYTASEKSQQFHPLVTEFLSKMGDVDIFQERLDWHLEEKENLEEEKEKRLRVGLDLSPPDQEWLDNYSAAENELLAQLKQAEDEAEELREACFSRGLVDEDGNPTDFEDRARQTFRSDDVDSRDEVSEYVKFPTLIPPPGGKQVALGDSGPEDASDVDIGGTINPRFRVDQWILHQLRMSVLGVKLLADTFEIESGDSIKDEGRWQAEVLAEWFKDSGEKLDIGPRTSSSAFNTQAPQEIRSVSSLTSRADEPLRFGSPAAGSASSLIFMPSDQFPTPPHPDAI